ncbi:hypothetical protein EV663_12518 [Rhodovulum bhavnagarense]|uniref:Type III restriction enzyme n=1 Tax=Rhodovulum bhavnagarense TaxID=992286 RepID=A0A4R2RFR8_9RHOB|nr:hypothetical protein [Rhodovulum bhavnagarense]TCP58471.1 hypothetical protein EV663_12518 [Rhodovulum bhavnagarense]
MSEAQLIGRGARYYPFAHPEDDDLPRDRRKFDLDAENDLRILEQLHYHCSHNPRYIDDIKKALRNVGLIDETARKVTLRVKDSFKDTDFFRRGHVWVNRRIRNARDEIDKLSDYMDDRALDYGAFLSGRVIETGAFDGDRVIDTGAGEQTARTMSLTELGVSTVRFALDGMPFFTFERLQELFPSLRSRSQFITDIDFLGGVTITLRGRERHLMSLSPADRLDVARFALRKVEGTIKATKVDFRGTREFEPYMIRETLTDRTLKIGVQGEQGRPWSESEVPGADAIDLHAEDWHVFDESYGTDQEKHLIRFIHDHKDLLRKRFEEFYLVRNEKMVTIYSFDSGRAFEPDFILFLRERGDDAITTIQVFIEPKGRKLMPDEQWKEDFLAQIGEEFELATLFRGQDYLIRGLPFYNSSSAAAPAFQKSFDALLDT